MIINSNHRKNISKAARLVLLRRRANGDNEAGVSELPAGNKSNNELSGSASPQGLYQENGEEFELSNFALLTDMESEIFLQLPAKQSKKISIFVGLFVAVGGFLFGYDTGLINNISQMPYVLKTIAPNKHQFTTSQISILVSFLSLGTFFGALFAPFISDRYGRKTTMLFSTFFVFMVGNSLQVAATSMTLLVVGRVLSGLSVGLISAAVPLYQSEAAQKSVRGAIISTYQWAITWGLLVASAVSQGTYKRMNASSYRIPISLQYVWAFTLGVGVFFLPESPRYYVFKDRLDLAAKSLSFLRGVPEDDSGLLEELVEIKATYDYELSFGKTSFLDCFRSTKSRSKQRLRMMTGIALQAFQQVSGINFIFYYGVNFFNKTGIKNSYLVSFITYAVNVVFNVPGLFLVEYIGRRKLLLGGGIVMTLANFTIAVTGLVADSKIANKVMIAFICLFIASFSATWGGGVWVISAELYPLGVRAKCTSICAASNWLFNFICALITPYIVRIDNGQHSSTMGSKIFFVWGSLNAISVLVGYFTIYETSGLSLEEIDELYKNSSSGVDSMKWNKKIRSMPELFQRNAQNDDSIGEEVVVTGNNVHNFGAAQGSSSNETNSNENSNEKYTSPIAMPQFGARSIDHPSSASDMFSKRLPLAELNFVDLGNGLGITTYQRGPPSVLTDSSDEDEEEQDLADAYSLEHASQDTEDLHHLHHFTSNRRNTNGSEPLSSQSGSSAAGTVRTSPPKHNKHRREDFNMYMAQLINRGSQEAVSCSSEPKNHPIPHDIMSQWNSSSKEESNRRNSSTDNSNPSTPKNTHHK